MRGRFGVLAIGVTAFLAMSALVLAQRTAPATPAAPAKSASAHHARMQHTRSAIDTQARITLSKDDAMALQNALAKAGFYKGKADGIIGAHTRMALRSYQKENGLKVTGRPDDETLSKLGVTVSSASSQMNSGRQESSASSSSTATKKP